MTQNEAANILRHWGKQGMHVFLKKDLGKLFAQLSPKALTENLRRWVKQGLLTQACRSVYVFEERMPHDGYLLERIAIALRRGEYSYVSLESMLSEYGVISQIPIDRLTVMTTGRKGLYKTPYGVLELTHTKRDRLSIIEEAIKIESRPLRIATKEMAWRDLKRVGRNIHLVDLQELKS